MIVIISNKTWKESAFEVNLKSKLYCPCCPQPRIYKFHRKWDHKVIETEKPWVANIASRLTGQNWVKRLCKKKIFWPNFARLTQRLCHNPKLLGCGMIEGDIEALVNKLKKPAIFVGAGISIDAPSNLPSGLQLLKDIIKTVVCEHDLDSTLRRLTPPPKNSENPGDFLRFEYLMHGLRSVDKHLTVLNLLKDCESPNKNHYILAKLIIDGYLVITTNFDNLIELAYEEIRNEFDQKLKIVVYDEEFSRCFEGKKYRNCLFKIHGSIQRDGVNVSDSLQAEYTRILTNVTSNKFKWFKEIIQTKDLLVVGYSGSDDLDIMPVISNTNSNHNIIWVQHGDKFSDLTNSYALELGTIKSKYHMLGINQILYGKGVGRVRVISAPTSEILCIFGKNKQIEKKEPYIINDNYFLDWATNINLTDRKRRRITRFIEGDPVSINEEEYEKFETIFIDVRNVTDVIEEMISEFNTSPFDNTRSLSMYEEINDIIALCDNSYFPALYHIKGCVEYRLNMRVESQVTFRTLLEYSRKSKQKELEFDVLNFMDGRLDLSCPDKCRLFNLLNEIGYYPRLWKKQYENYYRALCVVESYQMCCEYGYFPEIEPIKAINDLIDMKYFSAAMGDVVSEKNIDNLLKKLDVYEA